ncbi:alpha/beta hydrolase-fold protein [Maioricimonas sp. JC845]|uniref:alpha/beta hydrolase family protein n=1 Tax=Maioricimonas sp. JC845 TaxID=3232138 RepID=UPI00345A6A97
MSSGKPGETEQWTEATIGDVVVDLLPLRPGRSPAAAVIVLPDYDGRSVTRFPSLAKALAETSLPILSPRVTHCWWTSQSDLSPLPVPPLEFVRETLCGLVRQWWNIEPPRIALMGIGTGGQGALQLAYRHARMFPTVAAIAPAIDFHAWHGRGLDLDQLFDSQEAARQQTVTLHLHPLNWPRHQLLVCDPADPFWFEGCERLASKLFSSGIPFEYDFETTADGNRERYVDMVSEPLARFLTEHLAGS